MTKPISMKPHTHPHHSTPSTTSTPYARLDAMQGRRNRRSKRRSPPKVPGAEIYVEIAKSLNNIEKNLLSGRFDGPLDRVMEAFGNLKDLNRIAYEIFFELHRETCEEVWALHTHVRSFRDELWKRDAKKITESTEQTAEITTHPSTPSAGQDAITKRRRKRRHPPELPGAEIYDEIVKSLGNVERNVYFGEFNGRPDLIMEAFKELNRAACDTFMEKHRKACKEVSALDTRVQAFWDEWWKRDAKK